MNPAHANPSSIHWPPDRFHWSVLDGPTAQAWKRSGLLPPGLWPDFADDTPASPDDLHAVCTPAPDGRVLVCAALKSELQVIDTDATSLSPNAVPIELGVEGVNPASLNMLIGIFEPLAARRARSRTHAVAAAIVLVFTSLAIVGSLRRTARDQLIVSQAQQATQTLLTSIGTPSAGPTQVHAELERLRQRSGFDLNTKRPRDAALNLQAILGRWPTNIPAKPQSITIGPEGAMIAVLVQGDASAFINALKPPDGWRLEAPSLTAINAGLNAGLSAGASADTRVNIRLTPQTQERVR